MSEAARISPLIKFCRWSLLLAGIWYGSTRWNYLHRKEEKYREHMRQIRPIRDAEEAARRRELQEKEFSALREQGLNL